MTAPNKADRYSQDTGRIIEANGIKIWLETFGEPSNPPLLLMMGNSCDAYMWPIEFCQQLASQGWYVIRFDQRDTGLSSRIDFNQSPYTLDDMADDAFAILDYLKIKKAHILGFSTGGAIALHFALRHKNRLASIVLMMTSINLHIKNDAFKGLDMSQAALSPPKADYIKAVKLVMSQEVKNQEDKLQQYVELFRLSNGSEINFDTQYFYDLFKRSHKRSQIYNGKIGHESNHALATSATKVLSEDQLRGISLPVLIIAGDEDPIFQVDHAHKMATTFSNSTLTIINGLGHVLNPLCFEEITSAITRHIKNTDSSC